MGNDFSTGQNTDGYKYSGFAVGAPCEASQKSGYTVIVDQGFYGDVWMGPQILAHRMLPMIQEDTAPMSTHFYTRISKPVNNTWTNALLTNSMNLTLASDHVCSIPKLNKSIILFLVKK